MPGGLRPTTGQSRSSLEPDTSFSARKEPVKSAWERALEKLDDAGIDRPDPESLSAEQRKQMEEIRSRAEAQLAELEIMKKKAISDGGGAQADEVESNYRRDRERIESKRDRDLERIRSGS